MKLAQKNFERDPTKKIFWSSETLRDAKAIRDAKARNYEQSSWFNYDIISVNCFGSCVRRTKGKVSTYFIFWMEIMGGVYQELGGAKHPHGGWKVLILMM